MRKGKHCHQNVVSSCRGVANLCLVWVLMLMCSLAWAHPEDEFCNDTAMDPVLCAQLAELDRAEANGYELPKIDLNRSSFETAKLYVKSGIEHIIPMGLDHVLFVLALVLAATTFRKLLLQITIFTLAHSVTLILSMMGVLLFEGVWIEVAIAASIAFVAFENIFIKKHNHWRMVLIFCFGLLHGLGFAGALSEFGIPDDHFFSALLGFNVGVEIGQIGFAAVVYLLIFKLMKKPATYRNFVLIPGSLFVGAMGLYWVVERLM